MKSATLLAVSTFVLCASGAWAHQAPLDDAEIAAIVVVANQVDIDAGKLAQSKASSKEVKAFAERMVADHTGVNQAAAKLVARLNVTPRENATSKALEAQGEEALQRLRGLAGKAFDQAYVANEVAYHRSVLDALDNTLIPSAHNAELKALLVKVRPAFVAHLEHAEHLQASLK